MPDTLTNLLLIVGLLVAVLDWFALARNLKTLEYFAKPGTMLLLLAWLWLATGFQGGMIWFALGLIFSLGGDIFLMLPRERFIAGLVSFLLAHLAYIVGFNLIPPPLNLASLLIVVLVALPGILIYRRIRQGLAAHGQGQLALPVLVYSTVISVMLISALLTLIRPDSEWLPGPALLASAGALLFFLSDTLLAWNKFLAPLPGGRVLVHITYHLGQYALIVGAAANLLNLHA
jgi:alkenylglycerophosphocholine/alkenylglycerophosphoethanolamine hydrolase